MNTRKIYFDMDGTLNRFYDVKDWRDCLKNEDTFPYDVAAPQLRLSALAKRLNNLQKKGYLIGVISWTAMNSTTEYHKAVEQAKLNWLKKHLASVNFDEIKIVRYNTPKHELGEGILFDDNAEIRKEWDRANDTNLAFDVDNILEVLGHLN